MTAALAISLFGALVIAAGILIGIGRLLAEVKGGREEAKENFAELKADAKEHRISTHEHGERLARLEGREGAGKEIAEAIRQISRP